MSTLYISLTIALIDECISPWYEIQLNSAISPCYEIQLKCAISPCYEINKLVLFHLPIKFN